MTRPLLRGLAVAVVLWCVAGFVFEVWLLAPIGRNRQ